MIHQHIGTIIGLSIAKEQLQAMSAIYNETANRTAATKAERKAALYNLKKCEDAIKANDMVRAVSDRELAGYATGPEAMGLVQEAISHNTDLFYNIIAMDYVGQKRVTNLIQKIKKS